MTLPSEIAIIAEKACRDPQLLCWIEAHPGLAGWMQAFFSVLAIVVALLAPFWLSSAQDRREQMRLKAASRRAAAHAKVLVDQFVLRLRSPSPAPESNRLNSFAYHRFDGAISELERIEVLRLDDNDLAIKIEHLTMTVRQAKASYDVYHPLSEAALMNLPADVSQGLLDMAEEEVTFILSRTVPAGSDRRISRQSFPIWIREMGAKLPWAARVP